MKDNNLFPLIVELIRNSKSVEEGTRILNTYLGAIIRTDEAKAIINSSLVEGPKDDCFDSIVKLDDLRFDYWKRFNDGNLGEYFKEQKELKEDYEHEVSFDSNNCSMLPCYDGEYKQRIRK